MQNQNRIAYLDGIRALAILAVVGVHWVGSQVPALLGGYVGVDIFFVLSGFIITTILWRSRDEGSARSQYGSFLQKRVRRLFPALVGMLIGTLALYSIFPGAPIPVLSLIVPALIALAQGFSFYAAAELGTGSPFAVTWSLSIEWMFYLLWPLAIYFCKKKELPGPRVAQWSLGVAGVLYLVALMYNEHWFYYGPQARFAEMLVGGALALFLSSGSQTPLHPKTASVASWAGLAAILAILGYCVLGPVQWSPVFRFVGLPVVVACTVYLIWLGSRFPGSSAVRVLGWGPLTFIGRISYSLYLWHYIGNNLFTRDNMGNLPLPVVAFLGVALAAILTGLSYRYLEVPFMKSQSSVLRSSPSSSQVRL